MSADHSSGTAGDGARSSPSGAHATSTARSASSVVPVLQQLIIAGSLHATLGARRERGVPALLSLIGKTDSPENSNGWRSRDLPVLPIGDSAAAHRPGQRVDFARVVV